MISMPSILSRARDDAIAALIPLSAAIYTLAAAAHDAGVSVSPELPRAALIGQLAVASALARRTPPATIARRARLVATSRCPSHRRRGRPRQERPPSRPSQPLSYAT
jgi:hypothetical protein